MAQKMSKNVTLVSQRSNVMYLSGTQNPKFSKIRRALSKNSTTKELLKCIEIGLTKAYIKSKQLRTVLRTLETVVRSRIHNVSFYYFMSGFG